MIMDLTVAICMYNAEKYIESTLSCVVNQTVQDFHLLIIDDCSTDDSARLVHNFFSEHPRQYELVSFPVNKGICAGRHFVEENVTSKYVLFVDSDDEPYPTLVEKLYAKITSDPDLMAVGCYLEYMDSEGKKLSGGLFLGARDKSAFYSRARDGKLIFMPQTAIYDRAVALSVGGYCVIGFPDGRPRYRDLCEDLDLWTRMSDLYVDGKAIIVIPEILCRYRKHKNSVSTNSFGMILRMRHVKTNVKRRRSGLTDLTFIEFMDSLSPDELNRMKKDAVSADALGNSYYCFKKFRLFAGFRYLFVSLKNNPSYLFDKIKNNFIRRK